jgi:hypothetical protein
VERRTHWLNAIDANCVLQERTFRNTAGRTYANTFVCTAQFEETCYEGNLKKLKFSAIPTKFLTFVVGYPPETRKIQLESCGTEEITEDAPPKKGRLGKKHIFGV